MVQKEQAILILLMLIILIVCYFAPLTVTDTFSNVTDTFSNVLMNPQGSYVTKNTFNPGSDVERWNINKNLQEPGTEQQLNLSSIQSSFPYAKNFPENYKDNEISLIKSDGVILGGYVPQIIRPFDSVTANPTKNSNCQWPCYSDRKFQQWCSEENAINYHAMRPIISPKDYNNNLKKMFKAIIDKVGPFTKGLSDNNFSKVDTAVFCTESQEALMSWLMQKIALQVTKMPSMQRNGPWKQEMFYHTDVNMYEYTVDSKTYFKIIFNLYNPLRSISTLVVATIFIVDGIPSLVDMDFVNNESMEDYMSPKNGFGPITGYNISSSFGSPSMGIELPEPLGFTNTPEGQKMWDQAYKKNPNEFDWNYMNTLEVQKFNKEGFYSNDPTQNIKIEGGVPDSLKKALRTSNCKEANLMSCFVPKFTGITAPSAKSLNDGDESFDISFEKLKTAINDGQVKNVYNNPNLVYDVKDPISLRQVETVSGAIYI